MVAPDHASFIYRWVETPGFTFSWHAHPELELTLVLRGQGQRFVGDHVDGFEDGDLVLLGEHLPHTWSSHHGSDDPSSAIVIQFRKGFLGEAFLDRPESEAVRHLFTRSATGLTFGRAMRERAAETMKQMRDAEGMARVTQLLSLLDDLATCDEAVALSTRRFDNELHERDRSRMENVLRYIDQRQAVGVALDEAARLVHMSPSAFCRFFKRMAGTTFVTYVNRVRINHACRLLVQSDRTVTEVCFETGFQNVSNFNRAFRKFTDANPREYRKKYRTAHTQKSQRSA